MIAAGWINCKLGDVLTFQRGFDLPKKDRKEGGIPIVSSSGISGYHEAAKVNGPGVVTGRYGTLGEVFYAKEDFWPLNTTLYVRDFKGNDPLFLSYFLRTLDLAYHNAAGAVPGLNRNALHLLNVRIPPLPTQRKIASVLSFYDDLIENNTRRIEILEEMARDRAVEVWRSPSLPQKVLDAYRSRALEGGRVYTLEDHAKYLRGDMMDLFQQLRRRILNLDPSVREEIKKLYVAYKTTTNFVDVVPQRNRLRLSLNMEFSEIDDPKGLCKDITDTGRWGNGDIEVGASSPYQIEDVMYLVHQSYKHHQEGEIE